MSSFERTIIWTPLIRPPNPNEVPMYSDDALKVLKYIQNKYSSRSSTRYEYPQASHTGVAKQPVFPSLYEDEHMYNMPPSSVNYAGMRSQVFKAATPSSEFRQEIVDSDCIESRKSTRNYISSDAVPFVLTQNDRSPPLDLSPVSGMLSFCFYIVSQARLLQQQKVSTCLCESVI